MATRIYRAQSKWHEYFIPTALRCQNYRWLDKNIDMPEFYDTPEFCDMLVPEKLSDVYPCYGKPEYTLDKDSIKAYYLSIRNIIAEIHNDKCLQDCKEFSFFNSDWYDIFKESHDNRLLSLEESMAEIDRSFLDNRTTLASFAGLQNLNSEKLRFLKLSAYFQHLNYRKGPRKDIDLKCGMKVDYYPTMCLDFSDSIDTMKEWGFITENSAIYSIDLDKVPPCLCYSYLQKYDYKLCFRSWDIPINQNKNELMKGQQGYCVYWPWKYTVEELQKNRMFDFRIENIKGDEGKRILAR
jgi:hypothetical protein